MRRRSLCRNVVKRGGMKVQLHGNSRNGAPPIRPTKYSVSSNESSGNLTTSPQDPAYDHASLLARFAFGAQDKVREVCASLDGEEGFEGTSVLDMRFGIHSGVSVNTCITKNLSINPHKHLHNTHHCNPYTARKIHSWNMNISRSVRWVLISLPKLNNLLMQSLFATTKWTKYEKID